MGKILIDKATNGIVAVSDSILDADEKYEVIDIKGKDIATLQAEVMAETPEVRHCWFDKTDGTWKEVKHFPATRTKYVDGKIVQNFDSVDNAEKMNAISEVVGNGN